HRTARLSGLHRSLEPGAARVDRLWGGAGGDHLPRSPVPDPAGEHRAARNSDTWHELDSWNGPGPDSRRDGPGPRCRTPAAPRPARVGRGGCTKDRPNPDRWRPRVEPPAGASETSLSPAGTIGSARGFSTDRRGDPGRCLSGVGALI